MTEPRDLYSPERRTALVLTGTGADGAYHAGVLRALAEAGVKIDLVAGRGIGAIGAMLAAVDGGARLWESSGLWRMPGVPHLYQWRWTVRLLLGLLVLIAAAFAAPLVFLAIALVVYPVGLLLGMAGLQAGATLIAAYAGWMSAAFAPEAIPTWLPRIIAALVAVAVMVLAGGTALAYWRAPLRRRLRGHRGWALLGAPLDPSRAVAHFTHGLWDLLRGGASLKSPEPRDLSRRYTELLAENLGHPGFRELLLVVHDLDARRDLVFGLVREPFRRTLFPPPGSPGLRRAEAFDLAGLSRELAADVVAASLSLPGLTEPPLVRFATDSYWRGEVHRLTDRPASLGRLLEEAAAAGVEQVILVSASPEVPGAHELVAPRIDAHGRISEHLASAEASALRDAVRHVQHRFRGVYVVRPTHNPVRPLDVSGAYDEHSDRLASLDELMERGYEDAYREFIEPVLGASGDRITQKGLSDG